MSAPSETFAINSAVVVCSAALVQQLTQARIPPNYVGVRRVPVPKKSKTDYGFKQQEDTGAKETSVSYSPVVFKIKEADGTERRMTRQEKKAMRLKLAQEKKLTLKADKLQEQQDPPPKKKKRKATQVQSEQEVESAETSALSSEQTDQVTSEKYHQLSVDDAAMEEEIAEFSGGSREGRPPVLLSPPMALCASKEILSGASAVTTEPTPGGISWIQYDDELSERWAQELKANMKAAEATRQGEEMRTMAYQLTPEAWRRMRPLKDVHSKLKTSISSSTFDEGNSTKKRSTTTMPGSKAWLKATCRPPSNLDIMTAVVFEYFFRDTPLHISCGAKFGSDFLVYDGPRSERHAFAGMRVLLSNNQKLPTPTAYDMNGYVRCLNTAGKLALLATVVEDTVSNTVEGDDSQPTLYRVAIVDVALEKILTAPTHQRHARTEKRRDTSLHLSKK